MLSSDQSLYFSADTTQELQKAESHSPRILSKTNTLFDPLKIVPQVQSKYRTRKPTVTLSLLKSASLFRSGARKALFDELYDVSDHGEQGAEVIGEEAWVYFGKRRRSAWKSLENRTHSCVVRGAKTTA